MGVAQLVEHFHDAEKATGSNPVIRTQTSAKRTMVNKAIFNVQALLKTNKVLLQ